MPRPRKLCIEYCYDVVSPYAYLGLHSLQKVRPTWKHELILRPVLLGGILKESGNPPPPTVPNKFRFVQTDVARRAKGLDLPFQFPTSFPPRTVTPMRLLTTVGNSAEAKQLEALTGILFHKMFVEGVDLNDLNVLRDACQELEGVSETEVSHWIDSIDAPRTKEQLVVSTGEAVKRGAFGAPTLFVTADSNVPDPSTCEMFFGSELENIARHFDLPYSIGSTRNED